MKYLVDEDLDNRIYRGILRRMPELDMIRVQDTEVASASDAEILIWASRENRVLITHDVNTMTHYFKNHLEKGFSSPGIFFVSQSISIRTAIDDLLLVARYSFDGEYQNQMRFIPLD